MHIKVELTFLPLMRNKVRKINSLKQTGSHLVFFFNVSIVLLHPWPPTLFLFTVANLASHLHQIRVGLIVMVL